MISRYLHKERGAMKGWATRRRNDRQHKTQIIHALITARLELKLYGCDMKGAVIKTIDAALSASITRRT